MRGESTHADTIGFGVGSCTASRWDADSIAPSYWNVDSGRVQIETPLASPGVSGSFRVFTHLMWCVPDDTTTRIAGRDTSGRMVMEGTFATRTPKHHLIRSLLESLGW